MQSVEEFLELPAKSLHQGKSSYLKYSDGHNDDCFSSKHAYFQEISQSSCSECGVGLHVEYPSKPRPTIVKSMWVLMHLIHWELGGTDDGCVGTHNPTNSMQKHVFCFYSAIIRHFVALQSGCYNVQALHNQN